MLSPPGGVVRLLVLVSTRAIKDGEELLQNYRMNPHVLRPEWWVRVIMELQGVILHQRHRATGKPGGGAMGWLVWKRDVRSGREPERRDEMGSCGFPGVSHCPVHLTHCCWWLRAGLVGHLAHFACGITCPAPKLPMAVGQTEWW